jgi:hypothetical protein
MGGDANGTGLGAASFVAEHRLGTIDMGAAQPGVLQSLRCGRLLEGESAVSIRYHELGISLARPDEAALHPVRLR